ncbi:hypothetical protein AYR66_18675 [Noviherbaspirillum denitrificans]|uniref:Pirin n=2 Tax=Noviherbaspirillum denitrificans TaxID=1968433 RepID=A0A254TNB3_9BURK|nr:hypothetical protein AYR66_18675 [Noviherbaspirillum denitrificans]
MFDGLADPILMVDHFEMRYPTFPPHPHAGFSAVTYLFEDSEGSFQNRDSLGGKQIIGPGALHWTMAGKGVMHEEVPVIDGQRCHGLQIFINLALAMKSALPHAMHLRADRIPAYRSTGLRARIVCGSYGGLRSPLAPPAPLDFFDVALNEGSPFLYMLQPGWGTWIYTMDSALALDGAGSAVLLPAGQAIALSATGDAIPFSVQGEGQFVLLSSPALHEPVVFKGPFAMESNPALARAFIAFQNGEMGRLLPSREFPR